MIKYNLHSLTDMVKLAQDVQVKVYWGGYFIRKDTETEHRWKEFWDVLEGEISKGHRLYVIINDTDNIVEFR